jgi:uncharacterized protein YfaS (alpha-2-macroglobulin family)
MRHITQFFLISVIVIACGKQGKLKVTETNFGKEVQVNTSLSFTFNEKVVPDSLIGLWTDDKYLQFTPDVEGSFKWTSAEKLVFIPRRDFAPSTQFMCKLTNKVLGFFEGYTLVGETTFEFSTPMVELVNTRSYWDATEAEGGTPVLKVNMEFNQKVDPELVGTLLKLKVNKEEKSYRIATSEASEDITLIISGIEPEDIDYTTEIKLSKGLSSVGGTMKTTDDFSEDISVPSPYKFNIVDVQTGHDGAVGTITVYTSQAVSEKNFKSFVSLSPGVKYEYEIFPDYFLIKSETFNVEYQYQLTIKKGIAGKIGGTLKHDYSTPLSFGKVEPTLRFNNSKEFYVSGNGSRNIEVSIINIPEVHVTITKIYENNIISYLKSTGNYYGYSDYYYDDYYYGSRLDADDLGDVVLDKTIRTSSLPQRGINKILTLDFEDKYSNYPGIYLIEIRDTDDYWRKTKKLLSISDIGVIVKEGKNNITVFANSIKTTQPLANAEITFIGGNNQVTHTGITDASGVLVYNFESLQSNNFKTKLITAKIGDDYNIIPLNNTRVNTSRFDVGGAYQNPSGMQAFIYGDRNLYRPGEKINLSAIIRDYEWKSPGNLPVKVKITTPNGKQLKLIRKTLNEFGSFETSVQLSDAAATGFYAVDVYTTTDVIIGSTSIKVEEFMPDRIKVDLSVDKADYAQGEQISVDLKATNMFGPPAANRNYEVEIATSRKRYYSKENPSYNYTIKGAESYFSNFYRDGKTNAEGLTSDAFNIPEEWQHMGLLSSKIFATVFDETGRPVNRLQAVNIYTQDVFYGVKTDDYYLKTGKPVRFELIAVDKEGKALSGVEARVELIRHEYKTVMSRSGRYYRYRSERVERKLEQKSLTINETSSSYNFIPDLSGKYELRIYGPESNTYVSQQIYAYGWGSTSYSSFKVDKEGQIDIHLDKEEYSVGEKAKVLLKTPFQGKVLVALEADKVLDYFYIDTDKRAASFEIDINETHVPNIYISATLIKPHEKSDLPLTIAHGFAPVKVENAANKMNIEISAAEKSRSNQKQIIKVKSAPNSAVTIAAVDEGILQVGGYDTPNPYDFFYQKRALEVESYTIYPYLFPELGVIRSSTGGGGSMEAKRLNPLKNNRVKLVSFWSGIKTTNNKGEAEFEIDIPQFSGSLRLMAVGYNGDKVFGVDRKNMQVADPIVQSVALPRFLSPGDKIKVPVILTNTTDETARCKVKIDASGPLTITGENSATISLAPKTEGEVVFLVNAKMEMGQSLVTVSTNALGEEFINKTDIPVRPAAPLQKRNGIGTLKAGATKEVDINIDAFIEATAEYKLVVSNNPMVQFTQSLDYLVRYPHGCIEQTVSKAFPQIYFSDLLGTVFTNKKAGKDAGNNVQAALDKIKLMQLYNGGLTYWPGHGTESWWGSVYAAHFALEAKKAGYDVDSYFLKHLLKYLKVRLREKKLITYYYNENKTKRIAPREVAYSLYVLSLAGEKPTALLNYYKSNTEQLSLDSKYLLAGAYALTGDMKKAMEVLPGNFEGEKAVRTFGGSFNSYLRDEAIALNILLETDPESEQIGIMAKHVSEKLRTSRYLNTQERSFGFLAMGKIARIAANSNLSGSVKSNGKVIGEISNSTITLNTDQLKAGNILLEPQGNGILYYFWESEGISKDGSFQEEDSYIAVRKAFYNRNGGLVTDNSFKQNDLVLVELSIRGLTNKYVENVAITDILPAGFEIENPRITNLPPGMKYPNTKSTPDYIDVRDDRINMFVNVRSSTRYYYYLVRCVSPGTFIMGPVGADAMYDGEYHSYNSGGSVTVKRK